MRLAGAALAAVAAVGLSGCGTASSPDEQAHNQQVVERIGDDLVADLDAEKVSVDTATFRDDAENDAKVYLFLRCDGCQEQRVVDRAVRAVWGSTITPLHTFSVRVVDSSDLEQARRDVVVADQESALVDELGERPVPSAGS